jgi:hypothetical protein
MYTPFSIENTLILLYWLQSCSTAFFTRKKGNGLSKNWPTRLDFHRAIPSSTSSTRGFTTIFPSTLTGSKSCSRPYSLSLNRFFQSCLTRLSSTFITFSSSFLIPQSPRLFCIHNLFPFSASSLTFWICFAWTETIAHSPQTEPSFDWPTIRGTPYALTLSSPLPKFSSTPLSILPYSSCSTPIRG